MYVISLTTSLHTLYESRDVCAFTAAVLGLPEIHPVADHMMAAPVSLHYEMSSAGVADRPTTPAKTAPLDS